MKRRSIELEGFGHGNNPIPAACRIGNMIMTGGVSGFDIAAQTMPADVTDQMRCAFANLAAILAAGGASLDDVIKINVFVKSYDVRPILNAEWSKAFPDPQARPARHVLRYDHLQAGMLVQLEATAVLS
ncbi:MAG: RidA family protein [Hyphomonadaceae bacterium]